MYVKNSCKERLMRSTKFKVPVNLRENFDPLLLSKNVFYVFFNSVGSGDITLWNEPGWRPSICLTMLT